MATPDVQTLWELDTPRGFVRCQMLTCCSGAELQLVERDAIVIRELYPEKSDLYERARQLRLDFERPQRSG